MTEEVAARKDGRNKQRAKADWPFATADARIPVS
jgi:hypothetical protein